MGRYHVVGDHSTYWTKQLMKAEETDPHRYIQRDRERERGRVKGQGETVRGSWRETIREKTQGDRD